MNRLAEVGRKTKETDISIKLDLDGKGNPDIATGIPFFDHMLTLFTVHGFFDLSIAARGDLEVDYHHTVEDVGLVLGDTFLKALGDKKQIKRYGHVVTPMDDALAAVTVDLSGRPYLIYNLPVITGSRMNFNIPLAREFFRAFSIRAGMNLHINVPYGENEHHIIEAVFKAAGRALHQAVSMDDRIVDVRSTKGVL